MPAIGIALAYLIGSVDFGVIVPRAMGIDIYAHGSGNPGTSNVFRTMGKKPAALVMLGDALKGVAGAAVGDLLSDTVVVGFIAGFAAVVGHCFPIWHGFKGGRGVATAIGSAIWLQPVFGVVLAIGWAAVVVATKTASVASLVAMGLFVPGYALAGTRGWALVWAAATALLVTLRHKDNIVRIIRRSENTVSGS